MSGGSGKLSGSGRSPTAPADQTGPGTDLAVTTSARCHRLLIEGNIRSELLLQNRCSVKCVFDNDICVCVDMLSDREYKSVSVLPLLFSALSYGICLDLMCRYCKELQYI